VTGLEQSSTGLKAQLIELCRRLDKQKVAVDELEASKSDLQAQLRDLRQQVNKQNTLVGDLEDENRTLTDQHTTTVLKLGTSQLELEQMKSELQSVAEESGTTNYLKRYG
jgi:chromosome segregation ATPase